MYLMGVCSPWSPRHPETPEVPRLAGKPQFCSVKGKKAQEGLMTAMESFSWKWHQSFPLQTHWPGMIRTPTHTPTKRLMCKSHHARRMQRAGNTGSTALASCSHLSPWLLRQYLGNICPQMKCLSERDCGPIGGREEIGENKPLGYLPTKVTFR